MMGHGLVPARIKPARTALPHKKFPNLLMHTTRTVECRRASHRCRRLFNAPPPSPPSPPPPLHFPPPRRRRRPKWYYAHSHAKGNSEEGGKEMRKICGTRCASSRASVIPTSYALFSLAPPTSPSLIAPRTRAYSFGA